MNSAVVSESPRIREISDKFLEELHRDADVVDYRLWIGKNPEGSHSALLTVVGKSPDRALYWVNLILERLAKGYAAFIRSRPEVRSEKNFRMDVWQHVGFVRFTVFEEQGAWTDATKPGPLRYLPLAVLKNKETIHGPSA